VGITDRGLEGIGDITSMEKNVLNKKQTTSYVADDGVLLLDAAAAAAAGMDESSSSLTVVKMGDKIMDINWDAHLITSADELYHTVWETISETTSVESPLDGMLGEIHDTDGAFLDSDTTLFTLQTDYDWVGDDGFMHEDEYQEFVDTSERGKFYEEP